MQAAILRQHLLPCPSTNMALLLPKTNEWAGMKVPVLLDFMDSWT